MLLVLLLAKFTDSPAVEYWNDYWLLLDVGLAILLSYGIYRKSRLSALGMMIYYVVSIIVGIADGHGRFGLLMIIFIILFAQGISGTFAYHRLTPQNENTKKPINAWKYIVLIPVGLIMFVIVAYGALIGMGVLPDESIITGDELNSWNYTKFHEKGILIPGEQIHLYYSDGLLSFMEDGNMVTDNRVISYWTEEDSLYINSAFFNEIYGLDFYFSDDFWDWSYIEVALFDGSVFYLILPSQDSSSAHFYRHLDSLWNEERSSRPPGSDEV